MCDNSRKWNPRRNRDKNLPLQFDLLNSECSLRHLKISLFHSKRTDHNPALLFWVEDCSLYTHVTHL